MIKEPLIEFFERDLLRLEEEISLYTNQKAIWVVRSEIVNSAGTLCLHLIGNMNHFIGSVLGGLDYIRNRDQEFASKEISRELLLIDIEKTREVVRQTLTKLKLSDFDKVYPLEKQGRIVNTDHMLLHLLSHLNYHLGQINYHRRLVD
jgi:uncharacterized damage-inducible protein DinB